MEQVCSTLGVDQPAVWAVLSVETHGFGFFQDRRPQILFERHIFHRQTDGRFDADNQDISNAKTGGYLFGPREYGRLGKAIALDRAAALKSASWGIGQVMGFNFQVAGFSDVEAMVAAMVQDEDNQLKAMAGFIRGCGLAAALQKANWAAFAKGYNGADYQKNDYDTRLAAAHAKYRTLLPDLTLRSAQAALLYLGLDPGPVDGLRGRRTCSALTQYQQRCGLPATGELDQDTEGRLLAEAFPG
jgi:hypothetical protein